jgi:Saxitoxin biosynthesis operon protein SxtJ
MAEGIPARLTAAEGRRFGLTVGLAFCFFGAIAWWRDHAMMSSALAGLGALLIAAGLAIPTQLGPVERAWMRLAHLISKVTTPIVMGAMYLLVLTPVGWVRRRFSGNPLVHAEVERSFWRIRPEGSRRSRLDRQF